VVTFEKKNRPTDDGVCWQGAARTKARGDAGGIREGGGRRQLDSAKPCAFGTASMAERWDDARVVHCNGRRGLIGFASMVTFVR
jgi:hypothetical protein